MDNLSRKQKRALAQQRLDMQSLMSTDYGRRFLRRLIDVTGVFSHADTAAGPQELAADNARRAVGVWLIKRVLDESQDPNALVRLMQEAAGAAAFEVETGEGDKSDE